MEINPCARGGEGVRVLSVLHLLTSGRSVLEEASPHRLEAEEMGLSLALNLLSALLPLFPSSSDDLRTPASLSSIPVL